jgi:hypothetical protein
MEDHTLSDSAMTKVAMNIFIDGRLESYAQFYDHALAREFEALTRGSKLEGPAGVLCGTWKAASNTMRLPWLAVASIDEVGLGAAIDTTSEQTFLDYLPLHLRQTLCIPKGLGRAIDAEIHLAVEAYRKAEKVTKKTFNRELVWKSFLNLKKEDGTPVREFPMAVWWSQQIGYGATYHAYENFLRTVIEKLTGKPGYRIYYDGKVQKDVTGSLGKSICDRCIDDRQIKIAKEIRNSLAHQGGYIEVDPATPGDFHGFRVIDNIVQIEAIKNRELFLLLQDRAHVFAEAALQKL